MVALHCLLPWLFVFALTWTSAASAEVSRFVVELSANTAFEGEIVSADFVIYTEAAFVDVEVSKFPEFRGFWSENVALRQSVIPTLPLPGTYERRAVIGTYLIAAMQGAKDARIAPMEIVVRFNRLTDTEVTVENDPVKLTLKKLPPPPPQVQGFAGAVGTRFGLRAEAAGVSFVPGEPFSLRYFLTGRGNLPEVNRIALALPEGFTILAQRSQMVSGPFQNKIFDISVTTQSLERLVLPPASFWYFNPATLTYESAVAESVELIPRPKPEVPLARVLDLGAPADTPDVSTPLFETFAFKALQALLALVWGALAAWKTVRAVAARRARHPRHRMRLRWRALLKASPEQPDWVSRAETLLFETISARSPRPLTTRRQAVAWAEKTWGAGVAENLRQFFASWENAFYRPEKTPPPEAQATRALLQRLKRPLLSRKPRWRHES